MSQTSSAPPTSPDQLIDTEIHCLRCGYNLEGLQLEGVCPECGTHIADSHRGTLLRNSSPEYLQSLHKGVFQIQAGVIAAIIAATAALITLFTELPVFIPIILGVSVIGAYAYMAYGWWQFSDADPQYDGKNTGEQTRQFVRISLIVVIVTQCVNWGAQIFAGMQEPLQHSWTADLLALGSTLINIIGMVIFFVASMLYVRWIGARIPNKKVVDRAGRLTWLGPLLMLGGLIIFFLPLLALVLYWNLLDWVRKDLKAIRGV